MNTRKLAETWMRNNYPNDVVNTFKSSKYFDSKDIWFLTCPVNYLDDSRHGELVLLLQHKNSVEDFYYIRIPYTYLRENRDKLDIRSSGDRFDFHISGKRKNWLVCERSQGINFSEFER